MAAYAAPMDSALASAIFGALIGGFLSFVASFIAETLVSRHEHVRVYRVRAFDQLLPPLISSLATLYSDDQMGDQIDPIFTDLVHLAAPLWRAAAIGGGLQT